MAKILKNTTASPILVTDTGVTLAANSSYTIVAADYPLWASSSDIVTYIGNANVVVNDGSYDLSKADGISLLQGNFKQNDFISDLKSNNRLKVDVSGLSSDNISEGVTNLFFTNERAQDAVGAILTDTTSVDFTYNDAANTITAAVLPAGVDHNSLQNYVANRHIDHSEVSISAGTGLSGGGDITASRSLSIANTGVTAGTYGSATNTPVVTVNAQGQVTTITTAPISTNLTADINDSTTLISTTSTGYVVVTGMSFSLPAGTYMVTGRSVMSTTSNSRYIYMAIFTNGTINTDSEIFGYVRTGASILSNSDILNLYTSTIVTLPSTQTVDLRWKTSGGTAQAQGYAITYLKIG